MAVADVIAIGIAFIVAAAVCGRFVSTSFSHLLPVLPGIVGKGFKDFKIEVYAVVDVVNCASLIEELAVSKVGSVIDEVCFVLVTFT